MTAKAVGLVVSPDRLIDSLIFHRNYDAEIFAFGKRLSEEFKSDTLKNAFTNRYAQSKGWCV